MVFDPFDREHRLRELWEAVKIVRPVEYSLFTFGESNLDYFLVCDERENGKVASVTRGEVIVKRPLIITPDSVRPEFRNFFEDDSGHQIVDFILARSASFSNLKVDNQSGTKRFVPDGVEAAVGQLNRQLDDQEEEHVAILTAPARLGGVAILRYAAERVLKSAPDNIQELRERGFLP